MQKQTCCFVRPQIYIIPLKNRRIAPAPHFLLYTRGDPGKEPVTNMASGLKSVNVLFKGF